MREGSLVGGMLEEMKVSFCSGTEGPVKLCSQTLKIGEANCGSGPGKDGCR